MISLENVLKTSLQDVWPRRIYGSWSRHLEGVLKTSSEDVWVRWIYSSWSRCLEDVLKTSSERWKTSSRRLHQDKHLLGSFGSFKNSIKGANLLFLLSKLWRCYPSSSTCSLKSDSHLPKKFFLFTSMKAL